MIVNTAQVIHEYIPLIRVSPNALWDRTIVVTDVLSPQKSLTVPKRRTMENVDLYASFILITEMWRLLIENNSPKFRSPN